MDPGTIAAWAATASAAFAAVSAGVAAAQIWLSRRDSNRRAALDQLRFLDARLQDLWHDDLKAARECWVGVYDGKGEPSPACRRYMAFLNALDMLGLAVKKGLVDRQMAEEHVKTLCREEMVSLSFIRQLQDRCGDAAVYEHLAELLADARRGAAGRSAFLTSLPTTHGIQTDEATISPSEADAEADAEAAADPATAALSAQSADARQTREGACAERVSAGPNSPH